MESRPVQMSCPHCDELDTPILVVRGNLYANGGFSYQCRHCHGEFSGRATDLRAS